MFIPLGRWGAISAHLRPVQDHEGDFSWPSLRPVLTGTRPFAAAVTLPPQPPSQGQKLCSPALQGLSSSRKTGPSQLAVTSMLQRFSLGSAMGSPDMREVVVEPRVPLQRVGFPCGQGRQVSPPCVIFPCPWRGRAPGMDDPAVTQGPDVSPRGSRIWGRVAPDADAVRSTRSPPGFI